MVGLVDAFHRVGHGIGERVEHDFEVELRLGAQAETLELVGDVALVDHEAYEHVLVGQFLGIGLGVEAVEHIVMLHGRVAAYGLEAAVVVGEDESVGRHHHTRAVAAEVDHGVLECILTMPSRAMSERMVFFIVIY